MISFQIFVATGIFIYFTVGTLALVKRFYLILAMSMALMTLAATNISVFANPDTKTILTIIFQILYFVVFYVAIQKGKLR